MSLLEDEEFLKWRLKDIQSMNQTQTFKISLNNTLILNSV